MFEILPLVAASAFGVLPVEMWVAILRLLDPVSLLTTARSSSLFLSICRGDPILRKNLKMELARQKSAARRALLNPGSSIRIQRNSPKELFGINKMKTLEKQPIPTRIADIQETYPKQGGGPTRNKRNRRYNPLRL